MGFSHSKQGQNSLQEPDIEVSETDVRSACLTA
jgi:hypothetical protein